MRTSLKLGLLAGLMAAAGLVWSAGPAGMGGGMGMMGDGPGMMQGMKGGHDPARMQAMMAQRHAALKTALKLTAAQEAAWKAFEDSAPMGQMGQGMKAMRPDPAEMAKLTTPERLDKMAALHAEHQKTMNAAMDKHIQATKALYDQLSAEQRKVFDTQSMAMMGGAGGKAGAAGHRMHGPGQGPGSRMGAGMGPGTGPCAAAGTGAGAANCPRAAAQ